MTHSAALHWGHAIMAHICRQQPNRHENLTVSTKGQCQTKPLVVSERAPGRARFGSTALRLTPQPFLVTLRLVDISAIRKNILFVFLSRFTVYFWQPPTLTLRWPFQFLNSWEDLFLFFCKRIFPVAASWDRLENPVLEKISIQIKKTMNFSY